MLEMRGTPNEVGQEISITENKYKNSKTEVNYETKTKMIELLLTKIKLQGKL